ncbi:MAG: hypothetical protein WBB32_04905 [Flavobacteriales bacterium]
MNNALRILARLRAAALLFTTVGLVIGAAAQNGNIAINATGAAAHPKALLDVSSISKGLLMPRMPILPATAPEGLTAYRTHASNADQRGFHIFKNGAWEKLRPGLNGWDIYGNTLSDVSDPNPDFIGTTDSKPLYFRTDNMHRMKLDAGTGNLSVGYPAAYTAQQRLDINGALSMYYVPGGGNQSSNTNAPGVFRYQPFGSPTGAANYRYGTLEIPAVRSPSTPSSVLNATNNYPLQYAAHWGNVDGTALEQGVTGPPLRQPRNNGWRAFENPYEERLRVGWSHFREAECVAASEATVPAASVPQLWSSAPAIPAAEQQLITPAWMAVASGFHYYRKQYLYLAKEVNMELAQLEGQPLTIEGLCPDKQVNEIAFYFSGTSNRRPVTAGLTVTVRNAPTGLDELNGFDNTPDNSGTRGCGSTLTPWPYRTDTGWEAIALSTPFEWDGHSNVLVEVAIVTGFLGGAMSRPVRVTQSTVNTTYAAQTRTSPPNSNSILPIPAPGAEWSCDNSNVSTRLPDNMFPAPTNWSSGASQYRPIIRFGGEVTHAGPLGGNYTTGTGNYIYYPGALVLEDGDTTTTTIPWGMWRPSHPTGNPYFAYKGDGTISAQRGIYDGSTRLNDHVFDRAFDGRVTPGDAAQFGGQRLLPLEEMEHFTRTHRHLPTMKGREEWDRSGGFSLGDLTNQLWATTETHALYVAELHDKLNVIEMLTNDRPLTAAEFNMARQQLATMAEYTDAQKARLIAALRKRAPLTPPSR